MKRKPQYSVPYTIGVICERIKDFHHWKHNLGITDTVSDTSRSFIKNEFKYIAVVTEDRLRGVAIHGIIETDNCKFNKHYPNIMNYLQHSLH